MRALIATLMLAAAALPAFAQEAPDDILQQAPAVLQPAQPAAPTVTVAPEDAFDKPRPDLACYDAGAGKLRVARRDESHGIDTMHPEPVILESMPEGWKAADFDVLIENGNCVRRPVARNLDAEDQMLQFDARAARKAARDAVKGNAKQLEKLIELQGADEAVVDQGHKVDFPRVPAAKRAEVKDALDKGERPAVPEIQLRNTME